ncbi:MAG: alpha/beta hydrolase [Nitriliruptoraceae bacterium]
MTVFPIRLQTHAWNPLGGRRALLLHGLSADGGTMWRTASFLAGHGWTAIAPDLRSHGRSPTADDHRLDAFVADIGLLGDSWDLIVAHSFGGTIAAELLAGDLVAPAVLIDPLLTLDRAGAEWLRPRLHAKCGTLEAEQLQRDNPSWSPRDVHRRVLAAAQMTPDVVDAIIDDNVPLAVANRSAAWSAPVVVLAVDRQDGGAVTPDDVAVLQRRSSIVVIEAGTGHSVHCERPELVVEAIRQVVTI